MQQGASKERENRCQNEALDRGTTDSERIHSHEAHSDDTKYGPDIENNVFNVNRDRISPNEESTTRKQPETDTTSPSFKQRILSYPSKLHDKWKHKSFRVHKYSRLPDDAQTTDDRAHNSTERGNNEEELTPRLRRESSLTFTEDDNSPLDGHIPAAAASGNLSHNNTNNRSQKRKSKDPLALQSLGVESSDFDPFESMVYLDWLMRKQQQYTGIMVSDSQKVALLRWVILFFIACFTALVAVTITYCSKHLSEYKFDAIQKVIAGRESTPGTLASAGVAYVSIAVAYVAVAGIMATYVELKAAGSGISEIKCVLNGIRLPRVVRFKTLVAKAVGIIFSVSAGLPVGKEGPMIHSGAIIGAGASQGKSTFLGFDTRKLRADAFRNDREKRDFVSCGAAAGVAAAFGAPVGGVLFALEEGSSYWSKMLTWRTFFCAIISTYILDVFLSGMNPDSQWGELSAPGMFTFGDFDSTGQTKESWEAWEIPIFVAMGVLGGLFGAVFVSANRKLARIRMKHINTKFSRFVEVLAVAGGIAIITFLLPVIFSHCMKKTTDEAPSSDAHLVQFFCDEGYYNPVATFFFAPSESAIQQLFHLRRNDFTLWNLTLFFFVYGSLTCITYGIAVPSGLFIPSLLTGSAFGRFIGQVIVIISSDGARIDPGVYSLIGAAAFLGGVVRMTISLAVILLESTGNYQYGLPLMLVFFSARWTGNIFNDGIYDVHIALNQWPLLEERLPRDVAWRLKVGEVMRRSPVVVREIERLERLLMILHKTSHNGFPVVVNAPLLCGNAKVGTFAGLIQRKQLSVLLALRNFQHQPPKIFVKQKDIRPDSQDSTDNRSRATCNRRRQVDEIVARLRLADTEALDVCQQHRNQISDDTPSLLTTNDLTLSAKHVKEDLIELPVEYCLEEYRFSSTDSVTSPVEKEENGELLSGDAFSFCQRVPVRKHVGTSNIVSNSEFEKFYPRFPSTSSMRFSEGEKRCFVDLRPYVNPTPYVIHVESTVQRAYTLFRGLGLRHLPVVNDNNDIVGILTRHDLTEERLKTVSHRVARAIRARKHK